MMSCQHDEHIVLQALVKENERREAQETETKSRCNVCGRRKYIFMSEVEGRNAHRQ